MTKAQILKETGLTEEEFYKQYPTEDSYVQKFKNGGNMPKYNQGGYPGYYNPNMQGGYYPNQNNGYMYQPQKPVSNLTGTLDNVRNIAGMVNPVIGAFHQLGTQGEALTSNIFGDRVGGALKNFWNPAGGLTRGIDAARNGEGYGSLLSHLIGGSVGSAAYDMYGDKMLNFGEKKTKAPDNQEHLTYASYPKGRNTYGYKMGGDLPNYSWGGDMWNKGKAALGIGGGDQNLVLQGGTPNPSTTVPGPQDMSQDQMAQIQANEQNRNTQNNNSWGVGDYAKTAFNPNYGIGKVADNNIDDSTNWGKAAKFGSTMVTNPITGVPKALNNLRKDIRDSRQENPGAMPPPGSGPIDGDTTDYSYTNNTKGYAWGSQDAGGLYGGGNPWAGGQGGYGYNGQSPFYNSPYGNQPTAYGNYQGWGGQGGYGGVPTQGGEYQPYYGAFAMGGDLTPNAEVQGKEYISGDKPEVISGGEINTIAPGLHEVNGAAHSDGGVKVASNGDSYVHGAEELDTKIVNGLLTKAGLSHSFKGKKVKEQDVIAYLAKDLKSYRGREDYVSKEEMDRVHKKHEAVRQSLSELAEANKAEKESSTFKKGGNLPMYSNGGYNWSTNVNGFTPVANGGGFSTGQTWQTNGYNGMETTDSSLSTSMGRWRGTSPDSNVDFSNLKLTPATADGTGGYSERTNGNNWYSNVPWGKVADGASGLLNYGERQYGKYGSVNTQNYLEDLYGKGYRLSPGRFNPFGGKAMDEMGQASARLKDAADEGTNKLWMGARRSSRAGKEGAKGLSPTQQFLANRGVDAQEQRMQSRIESENLAKQASISGTLADLAGKGYNIAGGDQRELQRLDQLNLMSEANWDQLGLMGANAKDNRIQGIGQNAYNEYYMKQAYPYLNTGYNPNIYQYS